MTFYSRLENPSDPFADNYGVTVDKDLFYDADLNEYLQETIDSYETSSEDFELLTSDTTSSLAGKPAYSLTFSFTLGAESEDEEEINLRTFETGTLDNNSAYYITFTAEENAFAELLPVVEQMISTFKLLGSGTTPEPTTPEPTTPEPTTPEPTTPEPTTPEPTTPEPTTPSNLTKEVPSNFEEYINSGYGIRLIYPNNYELIPPTVDDPPGIVVTFMSGFRSALDPVRENVIIYRIPFDDPVDVETAMNNLIAGNNETFPAFKLIDSTATYDFAGRPGFKYEYTSEGEDGGLIIRTMNVGTVIDNIVYLVEFNAEDAQYSTYLPVAEQMINSFEISHKEKGSSSRAASDTGLTSSPFIELYNSVQWLSDNLNVHILVNQDTQGQASKYVPVVEEAINQWSTLLKLHSGNPNAWNFNISSSVGYLDALGPNANKDIIIEITGDPGGLLCSESLGQTEVSHPDLSTGVPLAVFTSCLDEAGGLIEFPEEEVYSTSLHELGHSLGLGHAFNIDNDLMCSEDFDAAGNPVSTCNEFTTEGRIEPSEADILALLYKYGKNGFSPPNRELTGIRPIYELGTPVESGTPLIE